MDEVLHDIQSLVKILGGSRKDGMASLATRILDESYDKMKEDFPMDRHDFWDEWPLSDINLKYAAIDAYVTYQLYKKIHFFYVTSCFALFARGKTSLGEPFVENAE